MSTLRRLTAVGATAALALIGVGSASAATPQRIYRDLADNGRIDGRYSRAEIQRAFRVSPPAPTRAQRPSLARKPIGVPRESTPAQSSRRTEERPLPFTALDAALLAVGAGPLLLIGARVRRRIAARPAEAPVASG